MPPVEEELRPRLRDLPPLNKVVDSSLADTVAHTSLGRQLSKERIRRKVMRIVIYIATVLAIIFVALSSDWEKIKGAFFDWDIAKEMFPEVITVAAKNTLIFTAFGFTGGLIIGLVLALMRQSSLRPYRWAASVYIEVFRGIPALVTIILIGYGLPIALDVSVPGKYGPGSLALAIVTGAYLAETIRAGIEGVPKGQMEAARSLGMTRGRAMRTVIIPQAFRLILPPLTNELVLLLKDTSLLYVLGTTQATIELAKFGRDEMSKTFNATPLTVVALVYLAITLPLTRLAAYMERRAKKAR